MLALCELACGTKSLREPNGQAQTVAQASASVVPATPANLVQEDTHRGPASVAGDWSEFAYIADAKVICRQIANPARLGRPRCMTISEGIRNFVWIKGGGIAILVASERVLHWSNDALEEVATPQKSEWEDEAQPNVDQMSGSILMLGDGGRPMLVRCVQRGEGYEGRSECTGAAKALLLPLEQVTSSSIDLDEPPIAWDGVEFTKEAVPNGIELRYELSPTSAIVRCTGGGRTATFEVTYIPDQGELLWLPLWDEPPSFLIQLRWFGLDDFVSIVYLSRGCNFPPTPLEWLRRSSTGYWAFGRDHRFAQIWFRGVELGQVKGYGLEFREVPVDH